MEHKGHWLVHKELWYVKSSQAEVMSNNEKIKLVALSVICLKEVSQSVKQLVSQCKVPLNFFLNSVAIF